LSGPRGKCPVPRQQECQDPEGAAVQCRRREVWFGLCSGGRHHLQGGGDRRRGENRAVQLHRQRWEDDHSEIHRRQGRIQDPGGRPRSPWSHWPRICCLRPRDCQAGKSCSGTRASSSCPKVSPSGEDKAPCCPASCCCPATSTCSETTSTCSETRPSKRAAQKPTAASLKLPAPAPAAAIPASAAADPAAPDKPFHQPR